MDRPGTHASVISACGPVKKRAQSGEEAEKSVALRVSLLHDSHPPGFVASRRVLIGRFERSKGEVLMKRASILAIVMAVACSMSWAADDGSAIYGTKCKACHGAAGEGKIGPKLQGTSVSEEQIVDMLTKGKDGKKAPHGKPVSGLTEDQAKAVAAYVKTLK